MRQNRLFSTLYITGTGLAIAMTVIVAVVYYVKLAPVYPEENRGIRITCREHLSSGTRTVAFSRGALLTRIGRCRSGFIR